MQDPVRAALLGEAGTAAPGYPIPVLALHAFGCYGVIVPVGDGVAMAGTAE